MRVACPPPPFLYNEIREKEKKPSILASGALSFKSILYERQPIE
jgi:hypothetical protein